MKTGKEKLLSISHFARLAGVSIRTLRYYDEQQLLKPQEHRESGYRLYSINDLATLDQILTLKFIGLSLKEIRNVLQHGELELAGILQLQRQTIDGRIRQLMCVARAIQRAEESLEENKEIHWNDFVNIIKAITMEKHREWTEQFYTAEQQEKIKSRNFSEKDALEAQNRWNTLIEEVRAHLNDDPASETIQQLADQWLGLIQEFTQGDEGIRNGLEKLYANMDSAPEEFRAYHERNREVYECINKAIALKNKD